MKLFDESHERQRAEGTEITSIILQENPSEII
jgi:hypothetical protein